MCISLSLSSNQACEYVSFIGLMGRIILTVIVIIIDSQCSHCSQYCHHTIIITNTNIIVRLIMIIMTSIHIIRIIHIIFIVFATTNECC